MRRRFVNACIDHPFVVLVLTVAATFFFAVSIPDVDFSASSETLISPGDPDRVYFEKIKSIFGDDQISVICLIARGGIYRKEIFRKIEDMTRELKGIDGVRDVVSITNIRNIRGQREIIELGEEKMEVNRLYKGELVTEIPDTPREWELLKERIRQNPLYIHNIVSPDGKATGINVFLEELTEKELYEKDIVGKIDKIIKKYSGPGVDISVTGIPQTKVLTSQYMKHDLKKFIPYTILLIACVLYVSFKKGRRINLPLVLVAAVVAIGLGTQSVWDFVVPLDQAMLVVAALVLFLALFDGHAILLPLAAVVLAVTWTVGFMGHLGIKFSLVNTVLPSLLISIGIAYVIHVMSEYYHERPEGDNPRDVLKNAVYHISLPVAVTAFTTMIGFASLTISDIPAIRDMGVLAVFGVFCAALLSLSFVPAMISIIESRSGKGIPAETEEIGQWLTPALRRLGDWNLKRAPYILAASALLTAVLIPRIPTIEVDTDFLSYFGEETPIIKAKNKLTRHLAGSAPFFVVVDGHYPRAFENPRMMQKLEEFEDFIIAQKGVDTTISVADYVKLTNRATYGNDPDYYTIPDTRQGIGSLLESLSSSPEILEPYLNEERSIANILVRTRIVGSSDTLKLADKIHEWAAKNFPEASVRMTGTLYLLNKSANKVSRGQMESLALAVFVILLVMSFLFVSFKFGLLSMVPNILPIVVLFGTMGLLNIPLDLSTSIIASIVIGLAVDDTIHFLAQFNHNVNTLYDEQEAIRATMATTGRPIAFTTATLCVGFLVVSFSDFRPIYHFGLLTGFILFVCLLGDLVVLPAILRFVKIITLWDLLGVKLGKDPKKTIKIFQGLSNRQARIAALIGKFKSYRKGERILTEGEVGEEMYVVVNGKVEIFSGDEEDRMSIAILGPGDNFGEMALVRHGLRSASVEALEDTELLILDEKSLRRIQRRYPRIAAAIYLNLTRILSDRLQITTVTAMLRGK